VCVCVSVDLHFVRKIEGGCNSALVRKSTVTISKKLISSVIYLFKLHNIASRDSS